MTGVLTIYAVNFRVKSSVNYNTDAGIDVVFDLFTRLVYAITLCMCVCAHPRSLAYTDVCTA